MGEGVAVADQSQVSLEEVVVEVEEEPHLVVRVGEVVVVVGAGALLHQAR